MATTADLLTDTLDRVREAGHGVVGELTEEQLAYRVEGRANPIGWLVWHLARVVDDHVADAAGGKQVWTADGWAERFALPLDPGDIGFGHSDEQVASVRVGAAELHGYLDAVLDRADGYLRGLSDADLDRIVDERWDPPVTLAVRLVSVIDDAIQHIGQAGLVHGLLPD
jgi:Protein of unknown function (DUF664)